MSLDPNSKIWTEGPGKILDDATRVAAGVSAAMADEGMLVISTVLGQMISLEASLLTLKAHAQLPPTLNELAAVLRKSAEDVLNAEVDRAKQDRPAAPDPDPQPAAPAQPRPPMADVKTFRVVSERIAAEMAKLMDREAARMMKEQGAVSPAALLGGLMLSMYSVFMSIERHAPEMWMLNEMTDLRESLNAAMGVFAAVVQDQGGPPHQDTAFRD